MGVVVLEFIPLPKPNEPLLAAAPLLDPALLLPLWLPPLCVALALGMGDDAGKFEEEEPVAEDVLGATLVVLAGPPALSVGRGPLAVRPVVSGTW